MPIPAKPTTAAPAVVPAAPANGAPPAAGGGAPPAQGAAPQGGQPNAPANGSAAPEVKPPESQLPRIDKLTKKEAALREAAAKLEGERSAWEAQRKQIEADAAEAKRLRALKENPLALVRELGMTPQQFLELAAKGDAQDPALIAAMQEQKAKIEEMEKKQAEREKNEQQVQRQQQVASYHGRIQGMVDKADERWQLTATSKTFHPSQVFNRAMQYCRENEIRELTPDQEGRLFEAILDDMEAAEEATEEKRIETAKWKKKFGSKFVPAPPAAPADGKKPAAPATTLTNGSATATPPPEGKKKWDARAHLEMVKAKHPEFFADGGKKP